jgi:hypothetical protein
MSRKFEQLRRHRVEARGDRIEARGTQRIRLGSIGGDLSEQAVDGFHRAFARERNHRQSLVRISLAQLPSEGGEPRRGKLFQPALTHGIDQEHFDLRVTFLPLQ